MFQRKKAATCIGIPSLRLYRPTSTYNRCYSSEDTLQDLLGDNKILQQQRKKPFKSQSFYTNNHSFPLPTVCFFSKEALTNEYATPLDVLQYVSPQQSRLSEDNEKLHLFIGILHSLFAVADDLTFGDDDDDTDDDEDIDDDDEEEEVDINEKEDQDGYFDDKAMFYKELVETPSFSVVGFQNMKVIVLDEPIKDLKLAIIVSSRFSDAVIEHYIQLLNTAVLYRQKKTSTVKELGEQITTSIQHWFNPFH